MKVFFQKKAVVDQNLMAENYAYWERIVAKAHRLTVAGDDAKRWQTFKAMGYLPATPSDIKLRVFPSYIFVPMSEVEQQVRAAIDARACQEEVDVPDQAPIRLPSFKAKQKPITSWFKSQ